MSASCGGPSWPPACAETTVQVSIPFLGTSTAHFPDDQHKTHTILGFPLSKKSIVHWHTPSISSRASDLLCGAFTSCHITQRVDVWSCALGVPWRLAFLGHGCISLVRSRHRIPFLRPPCSRRLSHRSTRLHSHRSSHFNTLSQSRRCSQRSSHCGLTVSARLDLSSTFTTPAVKKLGCCSRTQLSFSALFHLRLVWLH